VLQKRLIRLACGAGLWASAALCQMEMANPYHWARTRAESMVSGMRILYTGDLRGCTAVAMWRGREKALAHGASGRPEDPAGISTGNAVPAMVSVLPRPSIACVDAGRPQAMHEVLADCSRSGIPVALANWYDPRQADIHRRDVLVEEDHILVRHHIMAGVDPTSESSEDFADGDFIDSRRKTVIVVDVGGAAIIGHDVDDVLQRFRTVAGPPRSPFAIVDAVDAKDYESVCAALKASGVPVAWSRRRWAEEHYRGDSRMVAYSPRPNTYTVRYALDIPDATFWDSVLREMGF